MDHKNIIDAGQEKWYAHFQVPTHNLQPNETMITHIPGDQIKASMKLADMDLLNPTHIDMSIDAPPGVHLGASLGHGENGEIQLATHDRAVVISHEGEKAEGYHTVSTGARVAYVHTLKLTPSDEQLKDNSGIVLKRIDPKWMGMGPHNATAGAFKAEIDGKSKILVTAESSTGTPSAVHRFLLHNQDNAKLFNGAYTAKNRKTTFAPTGHQAIIMDPAHFEQAQVSLKKSLTTTSPFQNGLTAAVTNISNEPVQSTVPTFVNVVLHRKPVSKESGYISQVNNVVAQNDVHVLTGAQLSAKTNTTLPYTEAMELTESNTVENVISGADAPIELATVDKN
jgi:hypothetical protein